MIVLGVDPGSIVTGYGLVEKEGDKMTCIHSDAISLSQNLPFFQRIHAIYQSMVDVIARFCPDEMAIEDIFFAKNVKSALKIGHARGAVLIAATQSGLRIYEYSPLEIKKSVVGYGRATKAQVRTMVQVILKLNYQPNFDTADALAAAICHLNWKRFG